MHDARADEPNGVHSRNSFIMAVPNREEAGRFCEAFGWRVAPARSHGASLHHGSRDQRGPSPPENLVLDYEVVASPEAAEE